MEQMLIIIFTFAVALLVAIIVATLSLRGIRRDLKRFYGKSWGASYLNKRAARDKAKEER